MTEYINKTHDPGADGQNYGIPPNDGDLYQWQRILAGGGTSEFSEIRMRGPIYDKNGVELIGGGGGGGIPNNFTAVVDPTPNDDSTLTYQVGSEWLNTTTGLFFKARSVAPGAAVWVHDTAQTATNNNLNFNGGTIAGGSVNCILISPTGVGTSSGINSISIGEQADASGAGTSIAIGAFATANAQDAVAIGANSTATAANAVAIGSGADATTTGAVAVGNNCEARGADSLALGQAAVVTAGSASSVAVGFSCRAEAQLTVAVGHNALAQANNSIAIGSSAQVQAAGSTNSICIGQGCTVNNVADAILVGQNSSCLGSQSVVVGHDAVSNFSSSVAVGDSTLVNQVGGIALGSQGQVLAAPNPLFALGFGGTDPVVAGTQFDRLPVRVAGVNRNILLRNTDLALDDLTDVAITSVKQGQNLTYNGTNWINTDIPFSNSSIPAAIGGLTNAGINATVNILMRFRIPWDTSYYQYCRIWIQNSATSTSAMRVSIYDGIPNSSASARKCYSNVLVPPVSTTGFVVLNLANNISTNLIFTKDTDYTIMVTLNNPTAVNLYAGTVPAGFNDGRYGLSRTDNFIALTPPDFLANTGTGTALRVGFILSNTP